ncbi:MAG TPA: 1,4-alpha-glucan branching protein domain-containing protein [Magnetospirillaceae bacterium]|nr:1,4-alpha-glucan branching protein domain-containing protein [Magnetospirillaceae bacterium]
MERGYIALVLNAHLPFVRRPDFPRFLEERWLFEALSETYLPLLRVLRSLESSEIPVRLTLVLSPTLTAMLSDELLRSRYTAWLDSRMELSARELKRTARDAVFSPLASLYADLYTAARDDFTILYGGDVLAGFDYFYKKGRLEILTSAATHAFLPIYRGTPEAVSAQVETALISHRRHFGKVAAGLWLPQLGWYPGIEDILKAYSVRYTLVSTRGALLGKPVPKYGSFTPVHCPNGLAVFIRDAQATEAVWSETTGYPADPVYRDFYRDIGFDLPLDYVGPYLEDGLRGFTGFKYWAVTGRTEDKIPYDPSAASARARQHARLFLDGRAGHLRRAYAFMDRPPLAVCTYDAELFGHGWFEGPLWLESLFRQARDEPELRFVTLGEYLRLHPENPVSVPEFSSSGNGGYASVWLDGANDWIYRHSFKMLDRMMELAERFPNESGLKERVLNQAARETLLAMCSDWALLIRTGRAGAFAARQVEDAVSNFQHIYEMLCANTVGTEWITRLEKRNNLFPGINYRMFRRKRP